MEMNGIDSKSYIASKGFTLEWKYAMISCQAHAILSNILVYKQFFIRTLLVFGFNGKCNDQLNFFCPLIKLHEKPNIIFLLLQFIYLPVICHQRKPT